MQAASLLSGHDLGSARGAGSRTRATRGTVGLTLRLGSGLGAPGQCDQRCYIPRGGRAWGRGRRQRNAIGLECLADARGSIPYGLGWLLLPIRYGLAAEASAAGKLLLRPLSRVSNRSDDLTAGEGNFPLHAWDLLLDLKLQRMFWPMPKRHEIDAEPHEYATYNDDLRAFIARPDKRQMTQGILTCAAILIAGYYFYASTPAGYIIGSFFGGLTGIFIAGRFLPFFIKAQRD